MTVLRLQQTRFTGGEIAPELYARGDLATYANGAARLRNVFVQTTGGVTRRPGLRHVEAARGAGRLLDFEFNTDQTYLLVLTDGWIDVFADGEAIAAVETPWTAAHLDQIAWTQSADTLLIVHPELPPKQFVRTGSASFAIEPWEYAGTDNIRHEPFHRFAKDAITLSASGTSNTVTLTASADVFVAGHVGARFRIEGRQVEITAVASAISATANVQGSLVSTAATKEWQEAAFSDARGWPVSVAFHQDRLVIGGSRDLPNRLWLSKAGDLFNFDTGEGLDDEAIVFPLLSDQVNAIRAVFSGRHLLAFTSGAEWMVTGDPLTPGTVQVRRQTRIGSPVERSLPPVDVEGAVLFVSRNGRELREFAFADVEQAYRAVDLALPARHLFTAPLAMAWDARRRQVHAVREDGRLATLAIDRAEGIVAWTRQETDGLFRAIAVVGDDTYALVERAGIPTIERFDETLGVDAGGTIVSETPVAEVDGLGRLEGRELAIVADGAWRSPATVSDGRIALDPPVSTVSFGLGFLHEIAPLPPVSGDGASSQSRAFRLVEATFRLIGTGALTVDAGRGARDVPFRRIGEARFNEPVPPFSGDASVAGSGWRRGGLDPLWRIEQSSPLPCTVLGVTAKVKIGA